MDSYLVGSAGGIERVCSAYEQRVFILLQEDFDEIVTLVLQGPRGEREREEKISMVTFAYFND